MSQSRGAAGMPPPPRPPVADPVARQRLWGHRSVRRSAVAVLLVVALVATVQIVRGEIRDASAGTPAQSTRVPFGTWAPMGFGGPKSPLTAEARVVRLTRHESLHTTSGDVVRHDGAAFVVVEVQCRCPVRADLLAPAMTLLDDRGRQWEEASLFGTYAELDGLAKSFDVGEATATVGGVTAYGEAFEVPRDATGLALFISPYDAKLIYGS